MGLSVCWDTEVWWSRSRAAHVVTRVVARGDAHTGGASAGSMCVHAEEVLWRVDDRVADGVGKTAK